MNESFDQQAAHRPASPTGSRQAGQSARQRDVDDRPMLARSAAPKAGKAAGAGFAGGDLPVHDRTLPPLCGGLNVLIIAGVRCCSCDARWHQARCSSTVLLLRARRLRAPALGPSTFLIDRVAEELGDRLAAVLRSFERAVDLGTPTDAVRRVLAASGKVGGIIAADALAGRFRSRWRFAGRRRRGGAAVPRRFARSRRVRARAGNSSTICRARSSRSGARSGPTGCCWRRSPAAIR